MAKLKTGPLEPWQVEAAVKLAERDAMLSPYEAVLKVLERPDLRRDMPKFNTPTDPVQGGTPETFKPGAPGRRR